MSEVSNNDAKRMESQRQEQSRNEKARTAEQTEKTRQRFRQALERGQKKTADPRQQTRQAAVRGEAGRQARSQQQARGEGQRSAAGTARDAQLAGETAEGRSQQSEAGRRAQTDRRGHLSQRGKGLEKSAERSGEAGRQTEQQTLKKQVRGSSRQPGPAQEAPAESRTLRSGERDGGAVARDDGKTAISDGGGQIAVEAVGGRAEQAKKGQQAAPPKIPQVILEALAKKVYLGIDAAGNGRFDIELGGQMLAGLRLSITAKDGRVKIEIGGDNPQAARLLKGHHTELAGLLRKRRLDLESIELAE